MPPGAEVIAKCVTKRLELRSHRLDVGRGARGRAPRRAKNNTPTDACTRHGPPGTPSVFEVLKKLTSEPHQIDAAVVAIVLLGLTANWGHGYVHAGTGQGLLTHLGAPLQLQEHFQILGHARSVMSALKRIEVQNAGVEERLSVALVLVLVLFVRDVRGGPPAEAT